MQPREAVQQLKEIIELFLLEHACPLLSEPGHDVVDLSASSYTFSTKHGRLLWHIWNENTNLVRQITGITATKPGRLELRYQRFGKGPPGTLVVADSRAAPEQLERRTRRTRYAGSLRRWLHRLFPQWQVEELTTEADLARSFSGRFARAWISRGGQAWAVIGSSESDSGLPPDDILAFGLLWLDWLRTSNPGRVFAGLKLFLPRGQTETTLARLPWLDPQAGKWELYETGFGHGDEVQQRDPADFGNLRSRLAQWNHPAPLTPDGRECADLIASASPEIAVRCGPGGNRAWSVRGLVFARETSRGIVFGLGRAETVLRSETADELRELVRRLLASRQPDASDLRHPLYRLQPERWMESMVLRHMDRIAPGLGCAPVYEQVPAVAGISRGIVDLLTADREGRLVVLELKASEDLQLPLQALDYWMRVHWHQQRGELTRAGYFPGRLVSAEPPLLLLVSPALQFHPGCEVLLRYLSPQIEVIRVGVNENWRGDLLVVFRHAGPPAKTQDSERSELG